ncbi:MAG: reverse transcriptase domain-containing protein [Candidatus Methylomirabilaceae bacterium]
MIVCRREGPARVADTHDDVSSHASPAPALRRDGAAARPLLARDSRRGGGGQCVESSFDSLDHSQLRRILDQRVRDGVLRRTIDKWLAAGVLEGAELSHPDAGTPQGGVVSPCLANLYLHDALDVWFEKHVKPRLQGRGFMIRFADDAVMVFTEERDARRMMDVLPERLRQYGLTLHPTKTRLLHFRPPSLAGKDEPQDTGRESFDFLV